MSLRRSSVLSVKPPTPDDLRHVETLQVFGVKASYMNQFRDWIFSEVPEAQDKQIWDLLVVKKQPWPRLKTLRLRDEIDGVKVERGQAFRKLGPLVLLRPPDETSPKDAWLRKHRTRLNWLPRIRAIAGENRRITGAVGEAGDLPRQTLKSVPSLFFDVDELLFGLEAFKAARGLDRLHADRAAIEALLKRDDWYELFATADDMTLSRYQNRSQWQRMAQQLINGYAERFYRFVKGRWEAPYLEVGDLTENDPSVVEKYQIETTDLVETADEVEHIARMIGELREALESNAVAAWSREAGQWRTVPFSGHLYQPLLYVGKHVAIRVSPVSLDRWEAQFVEDLARWCMANRDREVYLLRNQAVTGLGFFQAANFFPDFLLWVQDGERQHLAFVDPKGLHHLDPTDPKVQFATNEIPLLQQIVEKQDTGIILHAFILSGTAYRDLNWPSSTGARMTKAQVEQQFGILFQDDDASTYIATMMQLILEPSKAAIPSGR